MIYVTYFIMKEINNYRETDLIHNFLSMLDLSKKLVPDSPVKIVNLILECVATYRI